MFNAEDYNQRYNEIRKVSFRLDADPTTVGLQSLTAKLAEIQALRSRVGSILAEAIHNKGDAEIAQKSSEYARDTGVIRALMNDDSVKGQKSEKMRDAAAQATVPTLVLDLHEKEVSLLKAEAFLKYVQQIYETLEAANNNLSRQISVIQMSIHIGELDLSDVSGDVKGVKHAT